MGCCLMLIMAIDKEGIMSIKLIFNHRLTETAQQLCRDYWALDSRNDYINHVKQLCHQYDVSPHVLFATIEKCYVCLDDVCCENCGCECPIEVPADIAYMRAKNCWFCEDCLSFSAGQVLAGR